MTIPYIKQVAASSKGSIESVLSHWLPGGKREGHEYLPLNPRRADSTPGSFSINLNTGAWSDFATGDKGLDLVSLVSYLDGITQGEAAKQLAAFLGIPPEQNCASKRASNDSRSAGNGKPSTDGKEIRSAPVPPGVADDGWKCIMPIPDDVPKPPAAHPKHGKPTKRYAYHAQDGRINFYHDRYEFPNGEKKQFSPLTLWQKAARFEWRFKVPPEMRPLFGLPGLLQFPVADAGLSKVKRQPKPCKRCCPIPLFYAGKAEARPWRNQTIPSLPGVTASFFPTMIRPD